MKKKQQITLHKNLQSGKANQQQPRNQAHNGLTYRSINDKNIQRQNKKTLSQQKIILSSKNRTSSKSSNKQSRQVSSSLGKNDKKKLKKKSSQSVKGSKKSIKAMLSQQQNSLTCRKKNIYTDGFNTKQKKQKQKKRSNKCSNRSQQSANEQNQLSQSITQSLRSQSQRLDVDSLVNEIKQCQFNNLHKLKLHCLNFIFRNRIIKDQQYDKLYQLMVQKFPDKEEVFRSILFEILSSLDN